MLIAQKQLEHVQHSVLILSKTTYKSQLNVEGLQPSNHNSVCTFHYQNLY